MKATQDESATLKQLFKHSPLTDELTQEAADHPQEAAESIWEVEEGYDVCSPGSYVAEEMRPLEASLPLVEES